MGNEEVGMGLPGKGFVRLNGLQSILKWKGGDRTTQLGTGLLLPAHLVELSHLELFLNDSPGVDRPLCLFLRTVLEIHLFKLISFLPLFNSNILPCQT